MASPNLGLRLNVFERALTEPRIRRVARKMSLSHYDVLGRLNHLWMLCYQRRSPTVEVIDADIATGELPGFVDAVIAEQLADRVSDSEIRVRGAEDALQTLIAADAFAERQSAKGRKSGESRRKMSEELQKRTAVQPGFDFGSNHGSTGVEPISDLSDLDQDLLPSEVSPDHRPTSGSAKPEAQRLARKLMEFVISNHPSSRLAHCTELRRVHLLDRWADTIEKLNRIDNIEWRFIEDMIDWSQRDQFWSGVVLGADGLRSKWDTMAAQRARRAGGRRGGESRPGPTELAMKEISELEALESANRQTTKAAPPT